MKILHITAHMGGGVGKAISDTIQIDIKNQHTLLLLETPEKLGHINSISKYCNIYYMEKEKSICYDTMKNADIIILHWWNHPMMAQLFLDFPNIEGRYILWCHVSGCTYPFLPYTFLKRFHFIFFTSYYSYENKYWSEIEREQIENKSTVIYGLGNINIPQEKQTYEIEKNEYKIGYIGTFTKSKMNPNFVSLCSNILERIPQSRFIMVGDKESANWLKKIPEFSNIEQNIEFTGYVENVYARLEKFDVFAYPLNSFHFGTTENAILEAMSIGVPVVCFEQAAEKYLIEKNKNGFLANTHSEYVDIVEKLYRDRNLAEKIGNQAKFDIKEKYSVKRNVENLNRELEKIVKQSKKKLEISYCDVKHYFLEFVSKEEKQYLVDCNYHNLEHLQNNYPIFCEQNKSSLLQFYRYFPESSWLKKWYYLIEEKSKS